MKAAFGRNIDIIAESADIKEALYLRFYELNLSTLPYVVMQETKVIGYTSPLYHDT